MRRMLGRLALATLLVVLLAPWLGPARAQVSTFPIIGDGGVLVWSAASITAVNTTSEVSMFQWVIPASLVATSTSVGTTGTQLYTGQTASGLVAPVLANAPPPLHFRAIGLLAGAAGTSVNIGVNFGGTTGTGTSGYTVASVALHNNLTTANAAALTSTFNWGQPVILDVWISPIASVTATAGTQNSTFMLARMSYPQNVLETAIATPSTTMAATVSNVNLASANVFNVVARWATAAGGSNLTFFNRVLAIGP